MALSWGERRKFIYTAVAGFVALVLLLVVYTAFFTTPSTCFDSKKNGDETGVDCGGSCALICANEAKDPSVSWARSFLTSTSSSTTSGQTGTYTAAAYIQNGNTGAGARRATYSFQLFDDDNHLIVEHVGVMDLPPLQTIAIVEPNIQAGSRVVARTLFSFSSLPTWQRVSPDAIPRIQIKNQNLSADGSTLSLSLANDTLQDAKNITVAAVLFDEHGVAIAASKSMLALLARKSSKPVVFTWPRGNADVFRAEVVVLPSF